jgi:choloylglycine hydrolase
MCTAITYKTKDAYFGRTLDIECSYGEEVIFTPRNFLLDFRHTGAQKSHYAIIGMGTVRDGYPLYYDAANEHGLGMAGLNFPTNACYFPLQEGKENLSPFELIPWLLGRCKTVKEARKILLNFNLCNTPFSTDLPLSPLHWMIADKDESIVVESTADGLHIYENPVGVLTNNPPFSYHLLHLSDYMMLTSEPPEEHFGKDFLTPYSRGMGAMGLPGDFSSASRFVRAAFVRENAVADGDEASSVSQFFHILGSVEHVRGCVRLDDGKYEITAYTSCINLNRGIYYYTTYENRAISAVELSKCDLEAEELCRFSLQTEQTIFWQN